MICLLTTCVRRQGSLAWPSQSMSPCKSPQLSGYRADAALQPHDGVTAQVVFGHPFLQGHLHFWHAGPCRHFDFSFFLSSLFITVAMHGQKEILCPHLMSQRTSILV